MTSITPPLPEGSDPADPGPVSAAAEGQRRVHRSERSNSRDAEELAQAAQRDAAHVQAHREELEGHGRLTAFDENLDRDDRVARDPEVTDADAPPDRDPGPVDRDADPA